MCGGLCRESKAQQHSPRTIRPRRNQPLKTRPAPRAGLDRHVCRRGVACVLSKKAIMATIQRNTAAMTRAHNQRMASIRQFGEMNSANFNQRMANLDRDQRIRIDTILGESQYVNPTAGLLKRPPSRRRARLNCTSVKKWRVALPMGDTLRRANDRFAWVANYRAYPNGRDPDERPATPTLPPTPSSENPSLGRTCVAAKTELS